RERAGRGRDRAHRVRRLEVVLGRAVGEHPGRGRRAVVDVSVERGPVGGGGPGRLPGLRVVVGRRRVPVLAPQAEVVGHLRVEVALDPVHLVVERGDAGGPVPQRYGGPGQRPARLVGLFAYRFRRGAQLRRADAVPVRRGRLEGRIGDGPQVDGPGGQSL